MKSRLIIVALIISINTYGQIKGISKELFTKIQVDSWSYQKVTIPSDAYYVTEEDFQPDEDHTYNLQVILNKHKNVVLPNTQLNINAKGVKLRDNQNLYFQENSKLKMIPNGEKSYSIILIHFASNVNVYNPQLIGDRESHLNNLGESGMGIDIRSSSNINIYNSNIKDTWGDGIYLGILGEKLNNNILIKDGVIDYARRNGISITSGINITVENVFIFNTHGVSPMEGIDVEPNKNSVEISNVTLKDIKTYNSGVAGISLYLSHLRHTKVSVSDIKIINHYDNGSQYGLRIGPVSAKWAKGEIQIVDSCWENNINKGLLISDITKTALNVRFKNSKIDSNNLNKKTFAEYSNKHSIKVGKNFNVE